jgi:hypothetical protein
VGIGFLSVLTKGEIVRLGELEHGSRSEVRGQIAEVKTLRLAVGNDEVFTSAI